MVAGEVDVVTASIVDEHGRAFRVRAQRDAASVWEEYAGGAWHETTSVSPMVADKAKYLASISGGFVALPGSAIDEIKDAGDE